jgi:hypothetical protein
MDLDVPDEKMTMMAHTRMAHQDEYNDYKKRG